MVNDSHNVEPGGGDEIGEAKSNRGLFMLGWFGGLGLIILVGLNFARRAAAIRAATAEPEPENTGPAQVPYRSWPRPDRPAKSKIATPLVPTPGSGFLLAESEPGGYVIVGDEHGGKIYPYEDDGGPISDDPDEV